MKTIGIVGSQSRIGTTTQALQILLCLHDLEYNAAYIQMGNKGYIEILSELYEDIQGMKDGKIYCNNIPMYAGSQIIEANRQGYDFIIKDYGNVFDSDFQKISFLEQDIKIVVVGSKANEIELTEKIMKDSCYTDVYYIFNFVAKEEQQDIKEMMGDRKQYTYFSVYTPNPFVYIENDSYLYLLGE